MNVKTWTCILLVSATFGIYYQTSDHDFIDYDDPSYIINNPHVNTGLNINNIAWAFTSIHASNWHPVTWLSHMLDVQLFGLDPKGHHLVNVAISSYQHLVIIFSFIWNYTSHTGKAHLSRHCSLFILSMWNPLPGLQSVKMY